MNYKILFISATLILSSCMPMVSSLPTVSPTASFIPSSQTKAPTTSPTQSPTLVLIDPLQMPTPINTPHHIPTALRLASPEVPDFLIPTALFGERVESFKNSLSFKITIFSVGFEMQRADRYIVYVEGVLTNISNKPIVVHKTLATGQTENYVIWDIFYNGKKIGNYLCCSVLSMVSADDYVVLQPNEFQKYMLGLELPVELVDDKGHKTNLAKKKIQLTATYRAFDAGFTDIAAVPSPYTDMNAWVGVVESNAVEYLFP